MATEMSGVDIGLAMALAMKNRVPNKTTTAQRARKLANMARGGPAGRAREDAAVAESEAASEWWSNMRAMERMDERRIAEDLARQRMANAPGRGLQVPEVAAENPEELALLAQMEADAAAGAQPQVAAPWVNPDAPQGFTSEGYVPGGAAALPQATSVPQSPQVAGPTGTSQSQAGPQGFTSEGYVEGGAAALPQAATPQPQPGDDLGYPGQASGALPSQIQQPGPQGFTSPGYVQGEQAGAADTAGSAALQWLNELFKKDEQPPQTPQTPQGAGSNAGAQGFASPGYVSGGGQKEGESFMDFTQRQHQEKYPQQGMSPEEQQKLQQITQGLESSRPDSNADATVSWPTGTNDSGFPPIGGISGQAREVSGSEQNSAIVQSLMSELETLGIDANILRSFDIDVDKFLSGVYNMADVEKLMSLAKRAGAPASMRGRIQTMSDNVSGTSGHGFNAEGYNEGVKQKPDETFMQYTQRMHQRNKDMNQWQNPDNAWVDPDRP